MTCGMMKSVFLKVITLLMWVVSKIYTYRLSQHLKTYRDLLYTLWIRNYIGDRKGNWSICYPCHLQGGGQKHITIGDHTQIESHSFLECWEQYGQQHFDPSISIGSHCNIGEYNHITACDQITIGDGLLTGRFVYIGDNAHGGLSWEEASIPPALRTLTSKGAIKIGNHVWIGDKATILGGVTIGDNVIIGANSVVTHDVPSHCVAAGNPAKIIKRLCQSHD